MIVYDKEEIKDYITIENVYTLLQEFGGEPEYTNFVFFDVFYLVKKV